jgi:hypothetical protein
MLKKRYRVIIDVDVTVADLSAEAVRGQRRARIAAAMTQGFRSDAFIPSEPDLRRQRVLLEALLADSRALDAWLRHDALTTVAYTFEELVPDFDCDSVLERVVERLPPAERQEYRELLASGDWYDVSDEFFGAFKAAVRRYFVSEVPTA